LGHEFRDYEHFCEYRKALIDWLDEMDGQPDMSDVLATNSKLFNVPVEELEAMISVIESVSHLSRDDFLAATHIATQTVNILRPDPDGDPVLGEL